MRRLVGIFKVTRSDTVIHTYVIEDFDRVIHIGFTIEGKITVSSIENFIFSEMSFFAKNYGNLK